MSLSLVSIFIVLNLTGAKSAVFVEIVLVAGLLGILIGFTIVGFPEVDTILYVLSLIVTIGVLSPSDLAASTTPLADAARVLVGSWGYTAFPRGEQR